MASAQNKRTGIAVAMAAMILSVLFPPTGASAAAVKIVALGASNTAGWGVGEANAYPAQLQAMLKAKGYDVHVANAGRSFDTTGGMLGRMDDAVPAGTAIVVVQPGGNDTRFLGTKKQRADNLATIERKLHARGIKVIVFENTVVPPGLYQWDSIHFTKEGHKAAASYLTQRILPLIGR
jgi:acyl-CoA thioesterase-1